MKIILLVVDTSYIRVGVKISLYTKVREVDFNYKSLRLKDSISKQMWENCVKPKYNFYQYVQTRNSVTAFGLRD